MIINVFRPPCPSEQQYTVCDKIAFGLLFQRRQYITARFPSTNVIKTFDFKS